MDNVLFILSKKRVFKIDLKTLQLEKFKICYSSIYTYNSQVFLIGTFYCDIFNKNMEYMESIELPFGKLVMIQNDIMFFNYYFNEILLPTFLLLFSPQFWHSPFFFKINFGPHFFKILILPT